jgi:hypothetical protein
MATGSWIYEKGSVSGGGSGGGGTGLPAPPVSIEPPVEVIFRSDHRVEVDVEWFKDAKATPLNFLGCAVYLEDPDISTGANHPLDGGSMPLDGTAQVRGDWAPVLVNHSVESPAVLPNLDSVMGSGQSYRSGRNIRIYLAAYGPSSNPRLVRATDPNPTPNILVYIPQGRGQGESGQEWAFLVTLGPNAVEVITDYNRLVPKYYLVLRYTPPDPSIPVPPGINHFGGCRIVFVQEDNGGNPIFPGSDTGMSIPVAQADAGFKSDVYEPSPAGGQFRVYFCSEDDSHPLGSHVNSLVEGTTPYAEAIIPPVPGTPDVTNFAISNQKTVWFADGSRAAHADFSWHLPDASNNIRYAGIYLYLVSVTGGGSTKTKFPKDLSGPQSNVAANWPMDILDVPDTPETWTIAAISYDLNGKLADDPKLFGKSGFHSPTVNWIVGPPTPGSPGSGQEFAPFVTIAPGAAVAASQSISSDGVGMVSFAIGTPQSPAWSNPTDNQFGNAQVAMVINHDTTKPFYWTAPANATSFQTPAIPSFGNIGSPVVVDFYVVSDDPQGNKNSLQANTPVIHYTYTPQAGAIIPARSGWFDDSQFSWVDNVGLQADNIGAKNIYVGKTLVVGGAPDTSFAGQSNGQIAVKNSSGTLRAWMGEQQPDQGMSGPPLWGAWFGQLWAGGTSPLDAPLWIDNQGIIQVGGIAAAKGSRYPYISVRDQTGLEMGRIGAALGTASGSVGDNVGPQPPAALTAGAWFTQLAVGGNNLSNWNLLITPDTSKPLGSQFLMRNIFLLQIDYAAQKLVQPYNNEYKLEFGSSAWVTTGNSQWQFPGIHIYEFDNVGNQFGSVFLNRGMILRGTQGQNYSVLASLVTYNGQPSGFESSSDQFWSELAMYSSRNPWGQTVYLASGNAADGNPQFSMQGNAGNLLFRVSTNGDTVVGGVLQGAPGGGGTTMPVKAYAYSVGTVAAPIPVIDAAGNWVGRPISAGGSQTPWMQHIQGNNFSLLNTGTVQSGQFMLNSGQVVIDGSGKFVGPGVDVGANNHVYAGYIATNQYGSGPNQIDTGTLNVSNNAHVTGTVQADAGYSGGIFRGGGVDVGPNAHVYAGYIATNQYGQGPNQIDTGTLNATANINATGVVSATGGFGGGFFRGAGVDVGANNHVYAGYIATNQYGAGPNQIDTGTLHAQNVADVYTLKVNGQLVCNYNSMNWLGGLQSQGAQVYAGQFGIYGYSRGWDGNFYDRDSGFHVVKGGILINNPPSAAQAETAVVCDQCGSWEITFRRKTPLPPRQLKLSDAVAEMSGPKGEPGVPQAIEMIAECDVCHFSVEYSTLVS